MVRLGSSADKPGEANATRDGYVSLRVEMYDTQRKWPHRPYRSVDSFTVPKDQSSDGCEESFVGSALIDSGLQHVTQGEHEKALKAFNVALNTQRVECEGQDHMCIAHTLGNIGAVYLKQGEVDKAKKELDEALKMKERLSSSGSSLQSDNDISFVDTLNNLGNIACLKGDRKSSLMYYQRALDCLKENNGPKKKIADVLYNIARLQVQQEEWDAALSSLTESCQLTKEEYGGKHIFLAQTLNLIGYVRLSTSAYDTAMRSFLGAHVITIGVHGPIHEDVAASWYNIGMVREAHGELKDAWEAYTEARKIYNRLGLDLNHTSLKIVRRSIANVERLIANSKKIESKQQIPQQQQQQRDDTTHRSTGKEAIDTDKSSNNVIRS